MDGSEDWSVREREFHGAVREYIICGLIFTVLYTLSYAIIKAIKTPSKADDLYAGDEEDALVYRISVWICNFAVGVSLGAVSLLPFSVLSNEILLHYPNSYYVQWLNSSLIHSLWTYVFLLSNLSVFILLPFSYFFIESQGFNGLRKGIMTRVYEALALCALVFIVIFWIVQVISIMLLDDEKSRHESFKIWNYQLPYVYSCISLIGVSMLLVCTPFGFATMFSVIGDLVVRPKQKKNLEAEILAAKLEEQTLQRRLKVEDSILPPPNGGRAKDFYFCNGNGHSRQLERKSAVIKLKELQTLRNDLERLQKRSFRWLQNLKYPIAMLLLLALTGVSVLMVVSNTIQLLAGFKSLPSYRQSVELGNSSLSFLGIFGALLEVVIIIYLMSASLVGLYSFPGLRRLRPVRSGTSMTKVIGNALVVLLLSSALPVLARTLGITNFDLLGAFGKIEWLQNFYLVLSYNAVFTAASCFCLVTKFTGTVRKALFNRLNEASLRIRRRHLSSEKSVSDLVTYLTHADQEMQKLD